LLAHVRRALSDGRMLDGTSQVVVGCSGGPDSQSLLHALHALRHEHGVSLLAASVHHGLRPDAHHDVALAAALAAELGVPFRELRVQVAAGASVQAMAREARYEALFALARSEGAGRVAVAHTADDQAETLLARLLRGTGVLGLAAMEPVRADGLVRPLLRARRADVLAYASAHGLASVDDPSNRDPRFLRARLRHRIVPELVRENPRLPEQLAALADDAQGAAALLRELADARIAACHGEIGPLRGESSFVKRLVLARWCELLLGLRPSRRQLEALEKLVDRPGEVRIRGDRCLRVDESGTLVAAVTSKRGSGRGRHTGAGEPGEGAA